MRPFMLEEGVAQDELDLLEEALSLDVDAQLNSEQTSSVLGTSDINSALEDILDSLEPESEEETSSRGATALNPTPAAAFLDGPETCTRDLLMSALDVAKDNHRPVTQTSQHNKPYSFLDAPRNKTERRISARFPMAIEGFLIKAPGKKAPLKVTSGSAHAFFIRTSHPLSQDTHVFVELNMLGSYRLRVPGIVVRSTDNGFAIQLDPDPRTIPFRAAFLDLARQAYLVSPSVVVEMLPPKEEAETKPIEVNELEDAWLEVLNRSDDDELHQIFIHACMRAQDIEYAVEKYREQASLGVPFAEKYLEQLGTILGFYNMAIRDDGPDAEIYSAGKAKAILILGFAALLLLGAAQFLFKRIPTEEIDRNVTIDPEQPRLINVNFGKRKN